MDLKKKILINLWNLWNVWNVTQGHAQKGSEQRGQNLHKRGQRNAYINYF